ncbi:hypothetical protein, partial [Salmonella sp. s58408]|uniref:hypothetical protein n=1 Tax=Salmonella sp. s58408 TaxID=3159701 RepID=UPI00397F5976
MDLLARLGPTETGLDVAEIDCCFGEGLVWHGLDAPAMVVHTGSAIHQCRSSGELQVAQVPALSLCVRVCGGGVVWTSGRNNDGSSAYSTVVGSA